ncbi:efflux RND transporter periplasmic adaptor subunit [Salinisphaera aquimarina]|uniref:Efflux RND transporter periplasmic adaptor subunit n=1 Tax=Salinisphaera aquimarina TaxID=2094031 RepID=A0ABV7ELR6_9GAMM
MASEGALDTARLSALFQLEHRARGADSLTALRFVAVNEARSVVDYRQAALLEPAVRGWRVTGISDVPGVDRHSLYAQWLERVVAQQTLDDAKAFDVSHDTLPEWERTVWPEVGPAIGRLVPLAAPGGAPAGWLWLARETPWNDSDRFLLDHMAEVIGHAFTALAPRRRKGRLLGRFKRGSLALLALVLVVAVLAVPVRLSALAPAEIVARNPTIVAAPMEGVVERVLVQPNARVTKGQPLVRLQDLEVRNRFDVANEGLKVAQARYRKALQESFDNPESRAELATLEAEEGLREVQREFAKQELDKIVLRADHDGLVIFNDPNDWAGRPVRTGERIMQLADPASREVRVQLPVDDAIVLQAGAPIKLFLDSRPLSPIDGEVERVSYKPEVTPRDQMVYRVTARLNENRDYLRIGLRGTAKVSGSKVPLGYYLFRRPITALRQTLGI